MFSYKNLKNIILWGDENYMNLYNFFIRYYFFICALKLKFFPHKSFVKYCIKNETKGENIKERSKP